MRFPQAFGSDCASFFFGGKWVGRCRIFFLKTLLWEPDLGWIYGLCNRTCAGNVHSSRNLGSRSYHVWHDLALLQNGNEPPKHKNYFLSIGTARCNVYTPRQGPLGVLAARKPYFENLKVDFDGTSLWVVWEPHELTEAHKQPLKSPNIDF